MKSSNSHRITYCCKNKRQARKEGNIEKRIYVGNKKSNQSGKNKIKPKQFFKIINIKFDLHRYSNNDNIQLGFFLKFNTMDH